MEQASHIKICNSDSIYYLNAKSLRGLSYELFKHRNISKISQLMKNTIPCFFFLGMI